VTFQAPVLEVAILGRSRTYCSVNRALLYLQFQARNVIESLGSPALEYKLSGNRNSTKCTTLYSDSICTFNFSLGRPEIYIFKYCMERGIPSVYRRRYAFLSEILILKML
jgi:hypothetical protein